MRITKLVHSCLLVEHDDTAALFDPGVFSRQAIEMINLTQLDLILVTHKHPDHMDVETIQHLVNKFPDVKVVAPMDAVADLAAANIVATPPDQVKEIATFDAPHESTEPTFATPEEIGIHYLSLLSDPGDSHSFSETKSILALPIQAPWGSTIGAIRLGLSLKPRYIIPIHDWHWSDEARKQMYDMCEPLFAGEGITFFKPETGTPIEVQV
jgi:L-ascorbate metabolism protein UlaG (beta-lactamase superfamily)